MNYKKQLLLFLLKALPETVIRSSFCQCSGPCDQLSSFILSELPVHKCTCSVYSFSRSCPKTVSRTREVFPTGSTTLSRLQLSRTRDCAHRSRHVGLLLGLKRVQFFPYRVPQFLIERVIELSSIFPMARMSNPQPTRTHTFSLDI